MEKKKNVRIKTYVTKVKAFEFIGIETMDLMKKYILNGFRFILYSDKEKTYLTIKSKNGDIKIKTGDMIIIDKYGRFSVLEKPVFNSIYETSK